MAYVRDNRTGKFSWVEGSASDDGPNVPPTGRPTFQSTPAHWLIALSVLAMIGLLGVWGMRAFKEPSVPIRRIRNHPGEFDGQQVLVRGRVGAVFQVGGSYAYYLMQGRDTIVVLTRGDRPQIRPNAEVRGSVSIGYLDGVPRPALFENRH